LISFPAMAVFVRRMLSIMLFSLIKNIYFAIHLLHECRSFLAHGFVKRKFICEYPWAKSELALNSRL